MEEDQPNAPRCSGLAGYPLHEWGFDSLWTAVSQDIDRKHRSARDERPARMELDEHAEG